VGPVDASRTRAFAAGGRAAGGRVAGAGAAGGELRSFGWPRPGAACAHLRFALALGVGCGGLFGCEVALVEDLSEPSANAVVVALTEADIAAGKARDPEREGQYRVTVAREDVPAALLTLMGE